MIRVILIIAAVMFSSLWVITSDNRKPSCAGRRKGSGYLLTRLKRYTERIKKLLNWKNLSVCLTILLCGCASETPRYSESYRGSLESVIDLNAHLSSLQKLLQNVQSAQSAIDESLKDVPFNSDNGQPRGLKDNPEPFR